jgi:predicted enzyme related to lactoylglutathione lyase
MVDRPGALGQVASRIGALRADIVSVTVHRQADGNVVDEFLLSLPDEPPGLVELLREEIEQVDDVRVESHQLVDDSVIGMSLTKLVWFELLADDCEAASSFYADALGWRTEPVTPLGEAAYHVIFTDAGLNPIGGIVQLDRAVAGSPPAGAVIYVETPDLERSLHSFEAAGGSIRSVTRDESHGSAVVADPWGNRLGLWQV